MNGKGNYVNIFLAPFLDGFRLRHGRDFASSRFCELWFFENALLLYLQWPLDSPTLRELSLLKYNFKMKCIDFYSFNGPQKRVSVYECIFRYYKKNYVRERQGGKEAIFFLPCSLPLVNLIILLGNIHRSFL